MNFFVKENIHSIEKLKEEYRRLAKIYHPDNKTGDNKSFIKLNKEYENLLAEFQDGEFYISLEDVYLGLNFHNKIIKWKSIQPVYAITIDDKEYTFDLILKNDERFSFNKKYNEWEIIKKIKLNYFDVLINSEIIFNYLNKEYKIKFPSLEKNGSKKMKNLLNKKHYLKGLPFNIGIKFVLEFPKNIEESDKELLKVMAKKYER